MGAALLKDLGPTWLTSLLSFRGLGGRAHEYERMHIAYVCWGPVKSTTWKIENNTTRKGSRGMHKNCAEAMMSALHLTSVEDIRCPLCRSGGVEVEPPSPSPSELIRLALVDSPAAAVVVVEEA